MNHALSKSGNLLANHLFHLNLRIIFAESCTGGLVSATLAENPEISTYLCGSLVTYQTLAKQAWLDVPANLLYPPGPGPVSEAVAMAMAAGALQRFDNAEVAAAITGDLGPSLSGSQDGLVWMAVHVRPSPQRTGLQATQSLQLPAMGHDGFTIRSTRQRLAAQSLLDFTRTCLAQLPTPR